MFAAPAIGYAASYAYVDQAGDVRLVEAASANAAIATAPGIHARSGVMLIDSVDDTAVVGDDVVVR